MHPERQLLFWVAAAILLILCIALLREMMLPFVFGAVIAYFLNPVADRLEAMGLGRTAAAAVIVVFGAVVVASLAVFIVPLVVNQLQLLAETLPSDLARIRAAIEARLGNHFPQVQAGIEKALADLSQSWSGSLTSIARTLWSHGLALVNLVSVLLITPVVVFYLLVDWHPMLDRLDSWLPRDHAPTVRRLAGRINDAISAFIRGQGTICLILSALYGAALTAVGLRYGLAIGLATGILTFIPFVGWALGLILAVTMAILQSWPDATLLLWVIGIFSAGMAIDAAFLSPRIVGGKIGLHPVWLMFALFAFSYLFGFVGTLVAVPVSAAIGVLVRHAVEIYLGSAVYLGRDVPPPRLEQSGPGGTA